MALLQTPTKDTDFKLIDFSLTGTDDQTHTLESVKGEKGTLLLFICNHCPYVKAVIDRLVEDCTKLQALGVGVAAIMPNDTDNYPEDSFDKMKLFADKHHFTFPYLIDDSQEVAKAYDAICTPDIFGFNGDGRLEYRGRVDSAGPNPADSQTTRELLEAMTQIAQSGIGPAMQFPSMGCSIKWK